MPAAIHPLKQRQIIELWDSGQKIKDIAEAVGVGRNAVARIVQAHIDKQAAAPKTIAEAELTANELFKLRYFLAAKIGIVGCPRCKNHCGYTAYDANVFCPACKTSFSFSQTARP